MILAHSFKQGWLLHWGKTFVSSYRWMQKIVVCGTYLPPKSSQRCCIVENETFPTVPQEKYCTKRENCSIKTKIVDIIFQYYVCDVMWWSLFHFKSLIFRLLWLEAGLLVQKRKNLSFFCKYKSIMHNQYKVRKHYFVAEEKVPEEKVYNNLFEICSSASPKNLRAEALPWRHLKCFLILTNPYRQQWHQQPVSASAPSLPGKIVKLLLLFKASKVRGWFQEYGKSLPSHFKDTRHSPSSATGCYKLTLFRAHMVICNCCHYYY